MRLTVIAAAVLAALVLAVAAGDAGAQGLTTEEAERFAATLPAMKTLGKDYEEQLGRDLEPEMGEVFAPFTTGIAELKSVSPQAYEDLAGVAADNGFDSPADWAETGDKVIAAFLALKTADLDAEMAQMRAQMTPKMMQRLPEAMRDQIMTAMAVMETVEAVPPAHVEAVKPVAGRLEQAFGLTGP